jgi:hypothetical protein
LISPKKIQDDGSDVFGWQDLLICDKAVIFLLVLSTTYLCESGFSLKIHIKNKSMSTPSNELNLRLQLTKTEPEVWKL